MEAVTNIKQNYSSDEEQREFGTDAVESLHFEETIPSVGDNTSGDVITNEEEDPLQEAAVAVAAAGRKSFVWECREEDFLVDVKTEECEESISKRYRVSASIKGKNGFVWSTSKSSTESNTQFELPMYEPKGKGPASDVRNPLEAWHLYFEEPILAQIVKSTNGAIRKQKYRNPYQRPTDLVELRAWLGLKYLCGIFRNAENNGPIEELWSLELGNAVFRAVMSFKRYQFLEQYLRFGEESSSVQGTDKDRIDPIFNVWEKLVINFRSYYAPSSFCALDDHLLVTADEASPFKSSCLDKSLDVGLRYVTLNDAKTLYTVNAFAAIEHLEADVEVLYLTSDIKSSKRNVTLNEKSSKLSTLSQLFQNGISCVGVVPTRDGIVPKAGAMTKNLQKIYAGEVTIWRNLNPLEEESFILSSGVSGNINAIKMFQSTTHSCQRARSVAGAYSCQHSATSSKPNWHLQFFHMMMDYAAKNAWILLQLSDKGNGAMVQRDFQRQLGLYLTQQRLKRRLHQRDKIALSQRIQICEILGEPLEPILNEAARANSGVGSIPADQAILPANIVLHSKVTDKRARCRKCKGSNNPKTRSRCQQCMRPLCYRHLIVRCDDCTQLQVEPPDKRTKLIS